MTTTNTFWRLAKLPLAVSLASTLAAPAFAVNFNIGEIEGQLDSSLSIGASWSTASRDNRFIGSTNGGSGYTQTGDDGRLNFKKGDTFSKIFKGIHDLELKYKDTGVFLRGKYWYDFELKDESRRFKDIEDDGRKVGAKSSGYELLDAFVYHNYAIGDQPGSVRLGKQVVSWGESTFIQNGINAINPIDVAAFRRPGAEVKEGLIPVNMFYVSQSITDNLSAEAFYQLSWKQTVVDNCGTFFSTADVAANGCNDNYNILNPGLNRLIASNAAAFNGLGLGVDFTNEGLILPRGKDNTARDDGQWGLALRWMGSDTEYGAYFMNYHSRTPFLSMQNADLATFQGVATNAALLAAVNPLAPAVPLVGRGSYFMDYPEDIRLYGLSFSTTLPTGTAWQGEISYRPNAPVQINTQDMTLKLISGTAQLSAGQLNDFLAQAGKVHSGYDRKEVTQVQTTLTHFFDQVLGAERLTLVGEVGFTHVGGLGDTRYGRDPIYGSPESAVDPTARTVNGWNGFTTKNSWGYRLRGVLDYNDVFAGINLKPSVAFSHDVDGYGPNGAFNEGSKAASLGLDAEYQNTYTASLSYTNFFDGRFNTQVDRDFLALSFGISF